MNDEPVIDYNVKVRYKDSNNSIRFSNLQSKSDGSNIRAGIANLEIFAVNLMVPAKIQELYDRGVWDRDITSNRILFVETDGQKGLSRTEALRKYKLIISRLRVEQLKNLHPTYDHFTLKDFGIDL